MKTKLQQLNLTYVRDIDGTEWLFIPSIDKNEVLKGKTVHNGCFCLSDKDTSLPYFNAQPGRVNEDSEIEYIRPANTYEIDSFIDVMDYYKYIINENNNLQKIK